MFPYEPSTTATDGFHSDQNESLPASEPLEQLDLALVEREIGELAAHINAATCRWVLLAAEFERRVGHEAFGFVSCASWLAWKCSLTPRAAREQLRVGRSLSALPRIRAAFSSGRLSYSKVRALTRVADPSMETELLELAVEATAAQLERVLRGYRVALEPDGDARAQARRHLSTQWEDDGTLSVRANLPPEEGAMLLKGLELAGEELRRDYLGAAADGDVDDPVEIRSPAGVVTTDEGMPDRVDALIALAEAAISRGVAAASGGDRHQVVVHVDADGHGSEQRPLAATLDDGVAVPAETARRLACDASIVSLVERGGKPLSVGRKTRSIPPAIRRALRLRDRGCRFPGCERERFVDAHHVEHWARGGSTSLDNLVQLCRHHHRLVHEGGYSISERDGGFRFHRPGGEIIETVPAQPLGSTSECLRTSRRSGGALVDQDASSPRSRGEALDFDLAVFSLCAMQERREGVGAAASMG